MGTNIPSTELAVEDRVIGLVAGRTNKPRGEISRASTFGPDLGMDSLDQAELVMLLEEEVDIKISEGDQKKLLSVGETIDYLCAKLGIKTQAPAEESKAS